MPFTSAAVELISPGNEMDSLESSSARTETGEQRKKMHASSNKRIIEERILIVRRVLRRDAGLQWSWRNGGNGEDSPALLHSLSLCLPYAQSGSTMEKRREGNWEGSLFFFSSFFFPRARLRFEGM